MKITGLMKGLVSSPVTKKDRQAETVAEKKATASRSHLPMDKIERLFEKHKVPLDNAKIKEIETFFDRSEGTEADKLKTLETTLEKGLDVKASELNDVHAALKEGATDFTVLLEEPAETAVAESDTETWVAALKLPEAVKDLLLEQLGKGIPLREVLTSTLKHFAKFLGVDGAKAESMTLGELVQTLKNMIQNMPVSELQKAVKAAFEALGVETPATASAPEVPNPVPEEAPVEVSHQPSVPANESAVGGRVVNPAATTEGEDKAPLEAAFESSDQQTASIVATALDEVLTRLEHMGALLEDTFDYKFFLVEVTTEKTIQAKADFKAFQEQVAPLLEPSVPPQKLAENIQTTIEALDKVILKTNVTLFTDMKMERDLLAASAELDKARTFIQKGDVASARALVEKVQKTVGKMTFEPSVKRVQAFAFQKGEMLEAAFKPKNGGPRAEQLIARQLQVLQGENGVRQAKDALDTLRFMGLNHEVEVAESLEGRRVQKNQDFFNHNVKEILLKLMKSEIDARQVEKAEGQLTNLSGQQSMNQQESGGQRGMHYFNYPVALSDGSLGEMKIYLNGARNGATMDYKNTALFFGVNTQRFGEVGIKVKTVMGQCDITVASKSGAALAPYFEPLKDVVEAAGLTLGTIAYEGTGAAPEAETKAQPRQTEGDEKGFDFKI